MNKLLLTKCLRCRGVVVYDNFYYNHEEFWGWKCLNCGEIVDRVILENRQLMRTGRRIDIRRAKKKILTQANTN
jgi:hypothetical protein